jgi:hypothetical protein
MPTRWFVAALFVPLLAIPCHAQDKFEAFGGYSYVRASETVVAQVGPPPGTNTFQENPNLNGWVASLQYMPFRGFGFAAEFGGEYGSLPQGLGGESLHRTTFLFGPQFSFPGRISPFVHFLFGVAYESRAIGPPSPGVFIPSASGSGFADAVGGGVDIRMIPHVWVRAIQVDFLDTELFSGNHGQPRISAGVVFHF